MNRNRHGSKARRQNVRVWGFDQARQAVPYITSIMTSLREHRLEAQQQHLRSQHLARLPGRPSRAHLIAEAEAARRAREARARYQEAEEELNALDVFCLDAIRGEAVVPFVHDRQLAWFLFDLFDAHPFQHWRYHSDPEDTRRPIAEALAQNEE
jgi:hypothetical protein